MVSFSVLLCYIILFMLLMLPGYFLGKHSSGEQGSLLIGNIITHVALPFLVFSKLSSISLYSLNTVQIAVTAIFPIIIAFLLFFISKLVFKRDKNADISAECFCSIFPNCGFFGIPLAEAIFPETPHVAVLVSLYNVFSTLMLLTLGVRILSRGKGAKNLKSILLRPINFAILFGAVFSLLGIHERLPFIITYSEFLSDLTIPLSMLALGYELSKLKVSEILKCYTLYPAAFIKLILSPVSALLLLLIFKRFTDSTLAMAILLSTSVSTAATAPSMAKQYGADCKKASVLTLGTTLFSLVTIPLVYLVYTLFF